MKATDFDLSKEIRFSSESGIPSFRNSRSLIFDADALGLLGQKLTEAMGLSRTREFFPQVRLSARLFGFHANED